MASMGAYKDAQKRTWKFYKGRWRMVNTPTSDYLRGWRDAQKTAKQKIALLGLVANGQAEEAGRDPEALMYQLGRIDAAEQLIKDIDNMKLQGTLPS